MWIFERLRTRGRNRASVERRLFETVINDVLCRLEEATAGPIFPESNVACCPADEKARL
jgi:hypothetical protein